MKLMFASDIHGSKKYCSIMFEQYKKEGANKLILLGDLLYHGPRNDLPEEYAPKEVIRMLNENKNEILCVRGNCDSEVDQFVLEFPILAEYMMIFEKNRTFFITHGHKYNLQQLPAITPNDILIHGHTHIQAIEKGEQCTYINPGSLSMPRNGNQNSYMIYENGIFTIRNLNGDIISSFELE